MDPQSFVRHLHSERENQTCHWGFEASNWRSYVHISDIYYKKPEAEDNKASPNSTSEEKLSPEKAQSLLDEVKKRFSVSRKQVGTDILQKGGVTFAN